MFRFFVSLIFLLLAMTQPVLAKTDIIFSPQSLQLHNNQTTSVDIRLDSTTSLLGGDLIVDYVPSAILVDKVEAGGFWQKPQILVNRIDSAAGKIFFSAFSYPAGLGSGNLVTIYFKQNSAKSSVISLNNQSIFAGENGQKISYTDQKTTITVISSTPTITPTNFPSPTNLVVQLGITTNPTITQPATEVSAQVTSASPTAETGPVILLEQSPTPIPTEPKVSTGFTLQLIALFLLIFGTLLFFTFKKNL